MNKRQVSEKDVGKILLTEKQIQQRVKELGQEIASHYVGKDLLLISVLKGSVLFMADLMRAIEAPLSIEFMVVSSYGADTATSGVVKIVKDIDVSIKDKHVLIVEDILDSGMTLSYLKELLSQRSPADIQIVTLLDKPARRKVDIRADYIGFEVPDEFLVGYGLDYVEYYRNLPYIGVLKREGYE